MTKQTEALRMAIEALEMDNDCECGRSREIVSKLSNALQACKEALAETQEPVATVSVCAETNLIQVHWLNVPKDKALLYTTPPSREWVGLSGEEILEIVENTGIGNWYYFTRAFAKSIEAKLREKNNGT